MTEIKGFCASCAFRAQEWVWVEDPDGQQHQELDRFCRVHETFCPDEGYCWLYSEEIPIP